MSDYPQEDHVLTVWQRPVEGSLLPTCSCGWEGPKRMTHAVATEDWLTHCDSLRVADGVAGG